MYTQSLMIRIYREVVTTKFNWYARALGLFSNRYEGNMLIKNSKEENTKNLYIYSNEQTLETTRKVQLYLSSDIKDVLYDFKKNNLQSELLSF